MKTYTRNLIALLLLLALLLSGCGSAPESAPAETAEPEEDEGLVTVIERPELSPDFSRAESVAMANFLCANRALLEGEYLYTLEYDEELRSVLGRYRVVDNTLREFTVLAENCVASYLTVYDGALYYLCGGRIERLALTEGAKPELLCESAKTLQLADGKLYYLDGGGQLCRMEPDGSGQTVLIAAACDYPYVMRDQVLLQKGEAHALQLCAREGGAEWRLTEGAAYAPLRVGQELYYTAETDAGKRLGCLDLAEGTERVVSDTALRGTAEFYYEGAWKTRLALEGDLLRQRVLPLDGGEEEACAYSGYHLLDHVSVGLRVDAVYEAGGRINSFLLFAPDGSQIRYFGGKVIS